jgi:hypothetical protein
MLKTTFFSKNQKDLLQLRLSLEQRIAGQHGHFTMDDYRKWLKKADINDLARALTRFAQLNQTKVYLFWENSAMA